ncbi:FtsW/RodA/SpoVE family cell cycle protein [Treponema socranskii]|uniref:Probable peptidoglycan glycosyltransferase FtsW n=1 Tax=Treponema socranskii subsp. socranskii VPI DR56BR1116 = ATCC 35536 TaxID=1125725 RepID=U2N0C1_TRESO|nr:putative peptidoglycan glycosyltransferase FtsW [Treponema socranskii]ERF59676.1 putative cell division protein FtsW [Treponema socranskii subsp. socranskii VPI DR56BR1116 = ATCC 35536]ERK04889.1 putative cell division protein FtsW [Treponema socranskii subsp. socranskii VPI DR56BR1116 = ATCC 35536]MDR9859221.1 putative peptidoglycan glycosyltransferase FtsW [Treponema socranskii]
MRDYLFLADKPVSSYRKSDSAFIACVILLCGLGIFALFVCSQNYAERMFGNPFYFVKRQLVSIVAALAGFFLFASMRIKIIKNFLPIFVLGVIVLCLLTFVPGIAVERNGAHRWIRMPFAFTLQPSEFAKFALILFLANFFDKQARIENPDEKSVLPAVIGLTFVSLLVFFQRDFSTSVFIFCVGLLMFFASGAKLTWLPPALLLIVPAVVFMILQEPYRIERIIGFLRPEEHVRTYNYQSIAAKRAISSGGFWGSGIGSGLVWINSIPEVQADYIFAGWAEAMGFFGVLLYFVMLAAFAWRGLRSAFVCKNRFAAYASFGCISAVTLQSLMNCAVVCGALPATGIPLPFFSLGGSSIIVTLCMCGFIVNASRCTTEEDENEFEDTVYEGKDE